jgi:hypothetical protein
LSETCRQSFADTHPYNSLRLGQPGRQRCRTRLQDQPRFDLVDRAVPNGGRHIEAQPCGDVLGPHQEPMTISGMRSTTSGAVTMRSHADLSAARPAASRSVERCARRGVARRLNAAVPGRDAGARTQDNRNRPRPDRGRAEGDTGAAWRVSGKSAVGLMRRHREIRDADAARYRGHIASPRRGKGN